ncbi:MAG: C-terminal binding protein [Chloroflexota bacterium]|nr:C-terminal binding protein [Chloroflexota bacterium]
MKPLVVITDCDHGDIAIEHNIFAAAGLQMRLDSCRTEEDVIRAGRRANALLTQYAPVTAKVLASLPDLQVVGRYGVGLDNIDLPAAEARRIKVVSVPDYSIDEVSDHALALILALTRRVVQFDRDIHRGAWDFSSAGETRRSSQQCVGVVGLGRIGRAVARKAACIGFRVLGHDAFVTPAGVASTTLKDLLARSDVVTLHLPLDSTTRHLIDAEALAGMKPGAVLVNTSRGAIVDQQALITALNEGRLAGAALDVLEVEPPNPTGELLQLPNVVMTPHAAFYSRESIMELKQRAAQGIVQALGEAPSPGDLHLTPGG